MKYQQNLQASYPPLQNKPCWNNTFKLEVIRSNQKVKDDGATVTLTATPKDSVVVVFPSAVEHRHVSGAVTAMRLKDPRSHLCATNATEEVRMMILLRGVRLLVRLRDRAVVLCPVVFKKKVI